MTPQSSRRWHIAFVAALGARHAARMNDDDDDLMREKRAAGVTPLTTAHIIRARINVRHGATIR